MPRGNQDLGTGRYARPSRSGSQIRHPYLSIAWSLLMLVWCLVTGIGPTG